MAEKKRQEPIKPIKDEDLVLDKPLERGNGFNPLKATQVSGLMEIPAPRADLNALLDKFADPKGDVAIFLAKIKSSITRKMVILEMQKYLDELVYNRENPEFVIRDPLEVFQRAVVKWSFPDNARWSDTLQKIIANYPAISQEGRAGGEGGDIFH